MVDLKKAGMGSLAFFLGYVLCIILQYVATPMLTALEGNTSMDNPTLIAGIVWFMIIIIYTLAMLVVPIGLIVWGIMIPTEHENKMFSMVLGLLWFIIGSLLTYISFTYLNITALANLLTTEILVVLFWIGLIGVYACNVIIIPMYYIIEAKKG